MKSIFVSFLLAAVSAFADHTQEWKAVEMEAKNSLEENDFKALEKQGRALLARDARTAAGYWKIDAYYEKLWFSVDENLEPLQNDGAKAKRYEAFIKATPAFGCAYVAYARFLKDCAWNYRGNSFAVSVTEVRAKKFKKYIDSAYAILKSGEKYSQRDPFFYSVMIDVVRAKSDRTGTDAEFEKYFKSGIEKFPDYTEIYGSALTSVSPRWGGSEKQVDDLIRLAVSKTQVKEGQGMYARLMLYYKNEDCYQGVECVKVKADWDKMKLGFSNILAAYPDPHNYNWIGKFVCNYGDKFATKKTIEMMGDNNFYSVWPGPDFRNCKEWSSKAK